MSEAIIFRNNEIASVIRKLTENRNQLPHKGDIYIGTGNKIEQGSTIPDTKGQNIIDAINDNAHEKTISASGLYASSTITSGGNITATGNITSRSSIKVTDTNGTSLAEMDSTGNISAQSFNAKSDKRLKENIVEYSPNKSILDLPIYSYNFISDEKKTKKIGCLAQDLKEICPEIVKEDNNGYLSIEENKIVYLLLDEVKKLKKRVDELEAR